MAMIEARYKLVYFSTVHLMYIMVVSHSERVVSGVLWIEMLGN